MAATTIVWWVVLIALVVVLAFAAARVVRALREIMRIKRRVDGYTELPVFVALANAGANAERMTASFEEIPALLERAQRAAAVIRRGPIPPDVVAGVVRIGVEIQGLREVMPSG